MARLLLICNPAAARASLTGCERVRRIIAGRGWTVEVAVTDRPGDAVTLGRTAVRDGVDRVAVYGGDGTVIEVARGLVGSELPLALVPGGTGNLLAGNLRLPRAAGAAARVATQGVVRRIDLGRVVQPADDRYFAVACGAGLDAEIMAQTSGRAKRRWGMAAYIGRTATLVARARPRAYRVTVDGRAIELPALTVLVANCGELLPPFVRLRDGIRPDDGVLDVVALEADGFWSSARLAGRLIVGRVRGARGVRYARGRAITVACAPPSPAQFDGEPLGATPFTVEVAPGALSVVVAAPRP